MPRSTTGPQRGRRHKKILKKTKGYKGTRSKLIKRAKEAYLRASEHAFAGRKLRKRDFRKLWIQRINAALTPHNLPYSKFIHLLKENDINLNRKMLAEIAARDRETFDKIVEEIK
ncbi:MAG: 50S ribosomal protein L20 [Patescibacteria group bacterium]